MWSTVKAENSLVVMVNAGGMYRKCFKSYVTCRILCSKAAGVETDHHPEGGGEWVLRANSIKRE